MRHLYRRIYLTIIASLLLVVVVAAIFWRLGPGNSPIGHAVEVATEISQAAFPPADAPRFEQQQAVERIAREFGVDLALYDRSLNLLAGFGRAVPPPSGSDHPSGWRFAPGGPVFSFRLPDQRWIVTRVPIRQRNPLLGLLLFLGAIALAVGVGAYPVVRGLTRRLERLQVGVETLGRGDLAARVKVEGADEVARLAESFNRAATRIEELVGAHRLMLANASHELRTPLARIRLGIELLGEKADAKVKSALERDIAELDHLIDEILLASRLEAAQGTQSVEDVDLLAIAAEECARYENCTLDGDPAVIRGDPHLLRRLIRNLLENAARHGKPPVKVELRHDGSELVLTVTDCGPGIPASDRERVFTPFTRLDGKTGGTGLGLSLVRQIARLHGGDAGVASQPDAASSFCVTLRTDNPATFHQKSKQRSA